MYGFTLGIISGTLIMLLIMASREHVYRKAILEKQLECVDEEFRLLLKKNKIALHTIEMLCREQFDNQEINKVILKKLKEI